MKIYLKEKPTSHYGWFPNEFDLPARSLTNEAFDTIKKRFKNATKDDLVIYKGEPYFEFVMMGLVPKFTKISKCEFNVSLDYELIIDPKCGPTHIPFQKEFEEYKDIIKKRKSVFHLMEGFTGAGIDYIDNNPMVVKNPKLEQILIDNNVEKIRGDYALYYFPNTHLCTKTLKDDDNNDCFVYGKQYRKIQDGAETDECKTFIDEFNIEHRVSGDWLNFLQAIN